LSRRGEKLIKEKKAPKARQDAGGKKKETIPQRKDADQTCKKRGGTTPSIVLAMAKRKGKEPVIRQPLGCKGGEVIQCGKEKKSGLFPLYMIDEKERKKKKATNQWQNGSEKKEKKRNASLDVR